MSSLNKVLKVSQRKHTDVKICTHDVNTSPEKTSLFITVSDLALKLHANIMLMLTDVKIVPQPNHIFLKSPYVDVYWNVL